MMKPPKIFYIVQAKMIEKRDDYRPTPVVQQVDVKEILVYITT